MSRRLVQLLCAALALVFFFGGLALARPWGENWGATPAETRQPLPGDDLAPDAQRATMAITIHAPADQVWPWVAQLGAGRGGFYSYQWFENNLLFCALTNADTILPQFQSVTPGDHVRLCAGDFSPGDWVVKAVEPGRALIMGGQEATGDLYQLVVAPIDATTTRLYWRTSVTTPNIFSQVFGPGFFVMMRGVLVGVQERAEGRILPWYARDVEIELWIAAFLGFLVAVAATAVRRRWRASSLAAVPAALVTLALVLGMPPVGVDLLGVVLVWLVIGWSFGALWAWQGQGQPSLADWPTAWPS